MKTILSAAAALLVASSFASAAISSFTSNVTQLFSPPVADFPALVGPFAQAWDEQQNRSGTVFADHIGPGNNTFPSPGILTGTFDSHFIHWSNVPGFQITGQVNFNNPVIAVAWGDNFLNLTDGAWGDPATLYPTGNVGRGINPAAVVVVFGNSVNFEYHGVTGAIEIEQMRVWTLVPAPGACSFAALGGLAALRRKRR